jgi:type II secretory pathway component GspD/PulD (secretin)
MWATGGSLRAAESALGMNIVKLDIKAQPLAEALMAFGAQTGLSVVVASELTTGKTSRTVRGQLTREQALAQLLRGTGLAFESSAQGTLVIVRQPPKPRPRGT